VLLSSFDRPIHDRKWPAARRKLGYVALPILSGNCPVGKFDTIAEGESGLLCAALAAVTTTARTDDSLDARLMAIVDGDRVDRPGSELRAVGPEVDFVTA
jgi:uncharacterized protein YcaQ